jgi:hypothetical protein
MTVQTATAQLVADAHRQAASRWDAAAADADRAGNPDLAERYRSRGDTNWLLAKAAASDAPQPPARQWDESPREAAAADDRYWDAMYDRDED